jgi:tetratricopeptide (TPR) repeat protein
MRPYTFAFINFLFITGLSSQTPAEAPDLASNLNLAIELEFRGEIKEAERVLLKLLREAEDSAPGSLHHAIVLNNLAVLYGTAERHGDAERYLLRSIRMMEDFRGERPPELLAKTKLQLASLYVDGGRTADALKLNLPPLIDQMQSPDGRARAQTILASLALLRKDFKTAESMFQEILAHWKVKSTAPYRGQEIGTVLNNMAMIALGEGRIELAKTRMEESLTVWKSIVGPDNPTLAKTMSNLASICMRAKQYESAVNWFEQATAVAKRTLGDLHPFTVSVQFEYATALKKAGRKPEATQVARAAADAKRMMRSPSEASYTIDRRDVMSMRDKNSR